MTALIRDIAKAGYYVGAWSSNYNAIFKHNPYRDIKITSAAEIYLKLNFGPTAFKECQKERKHLISWAGEQVNFLLSENIEFEVKPDLYCIDPPIISGDYIVLNGDASVFTKKYPHWQKVVDGLKDRRIIAVGGNSRHHESTIHGIESYVNKTNYLEFVNIIRYSKGLICGITGAMHIAAAWDIPTVVVATGKEDPIISMYPGCRYISPIGELDCCLKDGCYFYDRLQCLNVIDDYPKCMSLIDPDKVIQLVRSYLFS